MAKQRKETLTSVSCTITIKTNRSEKQDDMD